MFWVPSISPSSLLFYNGDRFKGWKGSLFVGALTTRALIRVSFNQPSQAERRENLLGDFRQRIRDVVEGPDGNSMSRPRARRAARRPTAWCCGSNR